MHHPAKDDVLICGAVNKLVREKSYVFNHRVFCLFRYLKRTGVPAPIAIKKNTVFKQFVRSATYSRFADAHGAAYQIQLLQVCFPLFLRMLYASIRYHIFCCYSTVRIIVIVKAIILAILLYFFYLNTLLLVLTYRHLGGIISPALRDTDGMAQMITVVCSLDALTYLPHMCTVIVFLICACA